MDLKQIKAQIQNRRRVLDTRTGEARAIHRKVNEVAEEVEDLKQQIDDYTKAVLLLASISEERQEAAQRQIEALVTRGLQTILGNEYSFHVVQTTKDRDKRPEVEFIVRTTSSNKVLDTPVTARGGGVVATVSVLLRVIILLLSKKDRDIPLILDESFAHLSARYIEPIAQFLSELTKLTGIQIILVTHSREFAIYADKIYEFALNNGATQVRELSASDI